MFKTLTRLLCLALFALTLPLAAEAKTFYWISHGSPADPVWTYFLAGANMWAKDTGQTVKTSFHNGDVAVAAGGDPLRHRRQGRRDRHHQPRSGQPGEGRQGGARGGNSGHQFQHARPEGELQRLCRRRSGGRRQRLGAVSRRPRPGEVRRFRLDAGRGSGRELRRRGREGDLRPSSSRSTSPGKSPTPPSTRRTSSRA